MKQAWIFWCLIGTAALRWKLHKHLNRVNLLWIISFLYAHDGINSHYTCEYDGTTNSIFEIIYYCSQTSFISGLHGELYQYMCSYNKDIELRKEGGEWSTLQYSEHSTGPEYTQHSITYVSDSKMQFSPILRCTARCRRHFYWHQSLVIVIEIVVRVDLHRIYIHLPKQFAAHGQKKSMRPFYTFLAIPNYLICQSVWELHRIFHC